MQQPNEQVKSKEVKADKNTFRSIDEFKRQYFPNVVSEPKPEAGTDPATYGSSQATKVLERVKAELSEMSVRA